MLSARVRIPVFDVIYADSDLNCASSFVTWRVLLKTPQQSPSVAHEWGRAPCPYFCSSPIIVFLFFSPASTRVVYKQRPVDVEDYMTPDALSLVARRGA